MEDNNRKFYININKEIKVEVTEEKYREHHKSREHHKYLKRQENKVTILSYEALGESTSGESSIADESVNIEETVINKIMLEKLNEALKTLSKEELLLIEQLIYNCKSKSEDGRKLHISHTTVGKRWEKLKRKLYDFLEK